MKQFTLDEIRTDEDGNIYLLGKKGVLRIKRVNDQYSSPAFDGFAPDDNTHRVLVTEIPSQPNRLVGGIAF